jgi:transcriptional regulator with XRE-family HTH domain
MAGKRKRLAHRRKTVGLSQERLAEAMRVDRSTVVRWERADCDPQPWHRPRLAAVLRISVEELAELLADVGDSPPSGSDRLEYALGRPGSVDLATASYLRKRLQHLDEQYEELPSTLLLAEAGQIHGQAVLLRRNATSDRVRRDLWALEAESATLMGLLVWDASQRRDHYVAVQYFDQAMHAAVQIRGAVLAAHAQLRQCYVALYSTHSPGAGLALAIQASKVGSRSPTIAGLAMLHAGEAYAMLGDERRCAESLDAANAHFAEIGPDDPAAQLYGPSQPGRMAGSCWLRLGKPGKAESVLDETNRMLGEHKKSTTIVLGNLALASIRQRSIDAATGRLHEALDVLEHTRGGGGLNVVFAAARELRPWQDEPAVRDVDERLMALLATAG